MYQKDKSSESKVKLRQASNYCKKVLEIAKFVYTNKTKESRNLAHGTFSELLIVFSTKVNLLYLPYSMIRWCCLLHLIKQNCLLETKLRTLIFSGTNFKVHTISVTPKMVKKVIMNLDFSKASGPDCI